jgi:hypothetical protein
LACDLRPNSHAITAKLAAHHAQAAISQPSLGVTTAKANTTAIKRGRSSKHKVEKRHGCNQPAVTIPVQTSSSHHIQ